MMHVECITPIVKLSLTLQCWISRLCNYSDAYILLSGYRTFVGARDNDAATVASKNNKQAIFKDFA